MVSPRLIPRLGQSTRIQHLLTVRKPSEDWKPKEAVFEEPERFKQSNGIFRSSWSWGKKEDSKKSDRNDPDRVSSHAAEDTLSYEEEYSGNHHRQPVDARTMPTQPKVGIGFGSGKKRATTDHSTILRSAQTNGREPSPTKVTQLHETAMTVLTQEEDWEESVHVEGSEDEDEEETWEEDVRVTSVQGVDSIHTTDAEPKSALSAASDVPDWFLAGASPPTTTGGTSPSHNDWTEVEGTKSGTETPYADSEFSDTSASQVAPPTIIIPLQSPMKVSSGKVTPAAAPGTLSLHTPIHDVVDLLEPKFFGPKLTSTEAIVSSNSNMPSAEDIDRLFGSLLNDPVPSNDPELDKLEAEVKPSSPLQLKESSAKNQSAKAIQKPIKPGTLKRQQTATPPDTPSASPKLKTGVTESPLLSIDAPLVSPTSTGPDYPEYLSIYHALPIFQVVAATAAHSSIKGAVLGALCRSAMGLPLIKGEVVPPKTRRLAGEGVRQVFCTFISDEGLRYVTLPRCC